MTTQEEKDHAEMAEDEARYTNDLFHPCIYCQTDTRYHCDTCKRPMCGSCLPGITCDDCWQETYGWNPRLAAHMAAVVTRAKQGTIALAALLMLTSNASAQDLPLVPTDGECAITRTYEDGGATALCGTDEWAFDADGGFVYLHGIKYFYRAEGTWYQVN